MAYDRQQLRLTWVFNDDSSPEIGVTGLNYSVIPGWSGAAAALGEIDLEAGLGENLIDEMNDMINQTNLRHAVYSGLISVKVAAVGTDGLYLADPKVHEADTRVAGTTVQTLPQATVVGSLWSGSNVGSANHGRMYFPHTALPLEGSASSTSTTTAGVVNALFADFVNNVTGLLNGALTDTVDPFIMSNQSPKPSKPVVFVKIGTVTDTQRRRRNKIPELYDTLPL